MMNYWCPSFVGVVPRRKKKMSQIHTILLWISITTLISHHPFVVILMSWCIESSIAFWRINWSHEKTKLLLRMMMRRKSPQDLVTSKLETQAFKRLKRWVFDSMFETMVAENVSGNGKTITYHPSKSINLLIWRFRFTEEMKRKSKWRFAMSRSWILAGVKNSWIVLSFAFSFDPWNSGFTPSVPCCNWTIPLGMVMECRYIALSWVEKAKWPSDHKKRKVMKGMRTRWSFSWISPRKWRGVFCFVVWKIWIYAGWHSLDEKIVYHPAKTRLLVMDSKYKSSRLITILVEVSHIVDKSGRPDSPTFQRWKKQPGDSKWPFYPLVGGYLTIEKSLGFLSIFSPWGTE